jgi:hypothetical protein
MTWLAAGALVVVAIGALNWSVSTHRASWLGNVVAAAAFVLASWIAFGEVSRTVDEAAQACRAAGGELQLIGKMPVCVGSEGRRIK